MNWGSTPVLSDRGILRSGSWLWARSIGWIVVLIFAIMLAFGLSGDAIAQVLPTARAYQLLAKVVGSLIVFLAYVTLVRLGERRWPRELDLAAAPFGLATGLLLGAVMFSAVMAILIGSGTYQFAYLGPAPAWHGIALALESGVLEEVLIRGVVMRLVWRAFGPVAGIAASAFLFGVGHFGNPGATAFTTVCVALEAGLMLGSFYALTGRLWVSIGVHAGWNFTQGYLFGASVSGGDFGAAISASTPVAGFPDWLTGASFGPEASLPSLAVCTIVGALTLRVAWRAQSAPPPPDFSLSVTPPTSKATT